MSDVLKPCPFCGSDAKTEPFGAWVRIKCLSHGNRCNNAPVRIWRTEAEAIAAWNTRALDAASYRAGLEAAARMVEDFRRYRGQPKDALVDKSFDDDEVRCPHCDKKHDLKKSRYWCREVYSGLTDLSAAIVALPTPSTLPQEGGEQ